MLVLVIRTIILYLVVVSSLRIMGKRQIGELQPSELVVAIMISDLASVPMQAIDIPLFSGIVPVLTLIIVEIIMSYAGLKSVFLRKIISGEPSVIISNGHVNEKELARLRFNLNDLFEQLRINGIFDIAEVESAILETNGQISIVPKTQSRGVTIKDLKIKDAEKSGFPCTIISDGILVEPELKRSGHGEKWLFSELKKRNLNIKDVFIASLSTNGELFVQEKEKNKGGKNR